MSARHLNRAPQKPSEAAQLCVFVLGMQYLYLGVLKCVFGYGYAEYVLVSTWSGICCVLQQFPHNECHSGEWIHSEFNAFGVRCALWLISHSSLHCADLSGCNMTWWQLWPFGISTRGKKIDPPHPKNTPFCVYLVAPCSSQGATLQVTLWCHLVVWWSVCGTPPPWNVISGQLRQF